MPLPADLSGTNANKHLQVWNGTLAVATGGTRAKNKTFTCFVEIYEQTSHDTGLCALAQRRKIQPRRPHDGKVDPVNDGTNNVTYYAEHGEEAATMASEWITSRWKKTVTTNANYWVRGMKQTLTWQRKIRDNGFSYEISLWYENTECYVAFHCYKNG